MYVKCRKSLGSWATGGVARYVLVLGAACLLTGLFPEVTQAYVACGGECLRCDGTLSDCQAAVDAASDGWVVEIADGVHEWTSQLIVEKGIHLKGQTSRLATSLRNSCPNPGWDINRGIIRITEDVTHNVEVSDLTFEQGSGANLSIHISMLATAGGRPILVHSCDFHTGIDMWGAIKALTNRGVIYGNSFTAHHFNNSGIQFRASSSPWAAPSTMGSDDIDGDSNIYVESNTFTGYELQCMDFDDNSRVVVRNNTFFDCGIASHGLCTSAEGMRHFEVYDNTFHFDSAPTVPANLNYYLYIRGGTGIITDNHLDDIASQYWGNKTEILLTVFAITRDCGQTECCVSYPCIRQVGQSHDGVGYITEPIHIWANSGTAAIGLSQYADQCGNGQVISDYIQEGRDYNRFAKPGYTKYTYPHPLTGWDLAGVDAGVSGQEGLTLSQNYPNPFAARTSIGFSLACRTHVRLSVYTALGEEIAVLVDGVLPAFEHEVVWDGRNTKGLRVAPGIYMYHLAADGYTRTRKMLLNP